MYAKVLVPTICVLLAIGACQNAPQPNNGIVQGVFIPTDALKALEEKARVNTQNENPAVQANSSPAEGTPQHNEPAANNFQTLHANQPVYSNQHVLSNQQPQVAVSPQSQPLNQQPSQNQQPTQYVLAPQNVPTEQSFVTQPTQQAILVNPQNPQNQPLLVNPQNPQPIYVSPQNPLVANPQNPQPYFIIQNGQPGQQLVSNPNQVVVKPLQNQGNQLYAVVPLNNQNLPNNGNNILVPVQTFPSNSVVLNAGK